MKKKKDNVFEYFVVFAVIGIIYFAFQEGFFLGLIVLIISTYYVYKMDWKNSGTIIGKFIYQRIKIEEIK